MVGPICSEMRGREFFGIVSLVLFLWYCFFDIVSLVLFF